MGPWPAFPRYWSRPALAAQVEAELIELPEENQSEFLGLRTYFSTGEKETRAWTITAGMGAPHWPPA